MQKKLRPTGTECARRAYSMGRIGDPSFVRGVTPGATADRTKLLRRKKRVKEAGKTIAAVVFLERH